ncbi:MAG: peptidylprolyl isomerase [Acidimicrobiales bacterium]
MPSEKRARKRAAREAKMAELERQRKRRAAIRRAVTLVAIVAVAIGIFALVNHKGKGTNSANHATTTTSTTSTTLPANAAASTTTVPLVGDTTSANCPTNFQAKLKKPTFSAAPPMIIDTSKNYTATITTDVGTFTIALDAKAAPKTVNNFVFLAENHFYDCVVFHRVIPNFMDQTGDPTGTGSGGPGYTFGNENVPSSYSAGEVAMANTGQPNSDGSQFFVLVGPYSNPDYSLFGTVTSGMSVVQKINADGDSSDNGSPPKVLHRMISVIISVT